MHTYVRFYSCKRQYLLDSCGHFIRVNMYMGLINFFPGKETEAEHSSRQPQVLQPLRGEASLRSVRFLCAHPSAAPPPLPALGPPVSSLRRTLQYECDFVARGSVCASSDGGAHWFAAAEERSCSSSAGRSRVTDQSFLRRMTL